MQRPIMQLLVAIVLAILGACLMAPVSAHKTLVGPDGQVVHAADGKPVIVPDRPREFLANWPAYLCFAGAGLSLIWAAFLALLGLVTWIRPGASQQVQPNVGRGAGSVSRSGPGGGHG